MGYNFYDSAQTEQRQNISQFTAKTFMWMFIGLLATFASAFAVTYVPSVFMFINATPYGIWGLAIAQIVLVFVLSLSIGKLKPGTATMLFFIYSVVNGCVLSGIFMVYNLSSIIYSFLAAAGIFGAMALFGYFTKKDLTKWGSILMFALIGCLIYSAIGMLFGIGRNGILYGLLMIVIFMGLTAFDMQRLKTYYYTFDGDEAMLHKCSIICALQLYLDFINIFLRILSLTGRRRN